MSFRKRRYGDTTHTAQPELLTKPVDLPVDIACISEHLLSPYVVGNTIELQLKTPYDGQTTDARIIKVFEPFTLSSTMVVRLASSLALEGDVILKLFDRRFATTIREEREDCPWTEDIEKEYHQFILDGGASKLFTELKANSELADQEGDDWNDLQFEAYLHHLVLGLYETEVEVYSTLKELQGNDIPRLFACVTVPNSTCEQTAPISQYVDIRGILLQYIVGVSLSDTAMHAPMECWQSICEDAIQIVHLIESISLAKRRAANGSGEFWCLEEAKNLGEKAINGMEKPGMDRDRRMMVAMVDLAVTYCDLRLMPEAEALVSRALHLMEETLGKDNPQTTSAMLDLSVIYQSQNKLDAVKDLAETVLARRERIFGKEHPDTVGALENLRSII
ncbi:hypothetical protein PENFLA_c017G08062 [Penicillium flavigenum]|uniref:Kinesin light chain n=1 Tax=Penicillium flavigenum TaxID=254877 RepID=A0A1V6T1U0_9EURO|nr:hypothetical protein PENFLA_c017G08062 [Penicillium flavigenum]